MLVKRLIIQLLKFNFIAVFISIWFAPRVKVYRPIPIIEYGVSLLTGSAPNLTPVTLDYTGIFWVILFFLVLSVLVTIAFTFAILDYLASKYERFYLILEAVEGGAHKDADWWAENKPNFWAAYEKEEALGELRFPAWRERRFQFVRPFYLKTLYCWQVWRDPARRAKQKHLARSLWWV